jgi:hypothetical protein
MERKEMPKSVPNTQVGRTSKSQEFDTWDRGSQFIRHCVKLSSFHPIEYSRGVGNEMRNSEIVLELVACYLAKKKRFNCTYILLDGHLEEKKEGSVLHGGTSLCVLCGIIRCTD